MKTRLSLMASFAILSSTAYAGGVAPMSVVEVIPVVEENFFVYASGGASAAEVKDSIAEGVILMPKVLGEDGTIGEVGVGYRYTENIFVTGFIHAAFLDEVDLLNFNASINYRFSDLFIMPYIGLIAGYSTLEWQDIPAETAGHTNVETKLDADHATFGLQAGAEYEMTDQFTLFGKYQIMTHDHLMEIYETSDIEHANVQSVQGGIRYEF